MVVVEELEGLPGTVLAAIRNPQRLLLLRDDGGRLNQLQIYA